MVQQFVEGLQRSGGASADEAAAAGTAAERSAHFGSAATTPGPAAVISDEAGRQLQSSSRAAVTPEEVQSYGLTQTEAVYLAAWRNFRVLGGSEPELPEEVRTRLDSLGLLT